MESVGDSLEPAFYLHYVAPQFAAGKISNTEAQARAFSWGLMQVMGQVAREHNFGTAPGSTNAPLAQLCDPAMGLEIGCTVFAAKLAAAHGDAARALQLWNGGGNPNYATEVLARAAKFQQPLKGDGKAIDSLLAGVDN